MGRMYSAQLNGVSVTTAIDVFELVAPAAMHVLIHGYGISQTSDFGDAQEEGLLCSLQRGFTTSGSGGSTIAPAALDPGGAASGISTLETANTTLATTTTPDILFPLSWNVRVPLVNILTPEMRVGVKPAQRIVLRIPAPADAITLSSWIVWEEFG